MELVILLIIFIVIPTIFILMITGITILIAHLTKNKVKDLNNNKTINQINKDLNNFCELVKENTDINKKG